ncbi:MAG: deoxyribodipyrimidine photo-lyase [Armatimonadetes bacterium]|nr:deoxyribodipyrimidine photo-lyase [Armatimonadota bacterium]
MPLQVVWFKRDLRTVDHAPLYEASQRGQVAPLYIFEPELWRQPTLRIGSGGSPANACRS